jgi:hypothetical protein
MVNDRSIDLSSVYVQNIRVRRGRPHRPLSYCNLHYRTTKCDVLSTVYLQNVSEHAVAVQLHVNSVEVL